ncbi:hypothetical protein ACIX1W_10720 [Bacteroides fragilis]
MFYKPTGNNLIISPYSLPSGDTLYPKRIRHAGHSGHIGERHLPGIAGTVDYPAQRPYHEQGRCRVQYLLGDFRL